MIQVPDDIAWTLVNIIHAGITFITYHYLIGSPVDEVLSAGSQGKYDAQTFWEQIDEGINFTPTKKFLTIMCVYL